MRRHLNTLAPFLSGAYFLGAPASAIGTTLLYVVGNFRQRSATVERVDDEWKKSILNSGKDFLLRVEAELAVSHRDSLELIEEKIEPLWRQFVRCVEQSYDRKEAINDCLYPLEDDVRIFKRKVIGDVMESEQ